MPLMACEELQLSHKVVEGMELVTQANSPGEVFSAFLPMGPPPGTSSLDIHSSASDTPLHHVHWCCS